MKKGLSIACAFFMVLGIVNLAGAGLVEIDFDDLTAGTIVTDQYSDQGVTFSLTGTSIAGPKTVRVSSSTYAPASGIALRPSEDGRTFYDIEMSFSTEIDYFSILSLDSDEPITATAYLGDDVVDSVSFAAGGNTEVYELALGEVYGRTLFDRVILDVVAGPGPGSGYAGGPEYFDNLEYNPTPEPGTVFLLGLGLIGLVSQRKRFRK
ncbi:hypothetical protein DENIS_3959 [Desulfonema ishimotonii]|uniref:Ice-binding protein C-terminal domain-containing protein n=1 Tax=Desulfonema ishimotonii TaxID=45657 RepID=A0A401G1B1_9BACT|nr:PEP-CTERM sorting domain-containing protein [Desulfonema ishimotonii]GBC62973.1 hypothetical protein DENIS_3959 [Desulfonema ishimotonii]